VLSWLWLRGRCRSCRAPISLRYPLVEGLNGALYLGLAVVGGLSTWTFVAMGLVTALLVLSLIDLDHHLLPNVITRPGIVAGLWSSFLPGWPTSPLESFLAAAGGYLAFAVVAWVGKWWYREEAMGQGDWKLAALLGAFLGGQKLLLVVFLASLIGAAVGAFFVAFRGRDLRFHVPLGTFLGAAGIVTLFCGEPLVAWYSSLLHG
jgi:leader peptidase (prepilin peptidase)/N-methyltransferase